MNTATDLTRKHYQRPEVKEIVLEFCQEDQYWRPLNGDKGWYKSTDDGKVRLRRPEDYDNTTRKTGPSMHFSTYSSLLLRSIQRMGGRKK